MYTPQANEERRIPVMHQLIRNEPLAALVTLNAPGLIATHLPMVLQESASAFGTLHGHFARANPQWRDFDATVEALAIFSGPQHYITPSWYPGKHEHGKEVPTWNYVVVHAYGALRVIHDEQWLMAHLEQLTKQSEADAAIPWTVADAPADFTRNLLRGIVGLELPISRLEGKWKVSQNRTDRDKHGVIDGLSSTNTPRSVTMRDIVEDRL
jgi:transcriptional regulator